MRNSQGKPDHPPAAPSIHAKSSLNQAEWHEKETPRALGGTRGELIFGVEKGRKGYSLSSFFSSSFFISFFSSFFSVFFSAFLGFGGATAARSSAIEGL